MSKLKEGDKVEYKMPSRYGRFYFIDNYGHLQFWEGSTENFKKGIGHVRTIEGDIVDVQMTGQRNLVIRDKLTSFVKTRRRDFQAWWEIDDRTKDVKLPKSVRYV